MKAIIFMLIFVSFSVLGDQRDPKIVVLKNDSSPPISYISKNGELRVLVPKYHYHAAQFTESYEEWGIEKMIEELGDKRKKLANEVCKNKYKPDSVTITVFFVSGTWEIEKLCKN